MRRCNLDGSEFSGVDPRNLFLREASWPADLATTDKTTQVILRAVFLNLLPMGGVGGGGIHNDVVRVSLSFICWRSLAFSSSAFSIVNWASRACKGLVGSGLGLSAGGGSEFRLICFSSRHNDKEVLEGKIY